MSRPRFLADHDPDEHIVTGVRRRAAGVEFRRVRDVGLDGRPDPDVLAYAAEQRLLVFSHDVNTMPAHAHRRMVAGLPASGLPVVQQTAPVAEAIHVRASGPLARLAATRRRT